MVLVSKEVVRVVRVLVWQPQHFLITHHPFPSTLPLQGSPSRALASRAEDGNWLWDLLSSETKSLLFHKDASQPDCGSVSTPALTHKLGLPFHSHFLFLCIPFAFPDFSLLAIALSSFPSSQKKRGQIQTVKPHMCFVVAFPNLMGMKQKKKEQI